MPDTTTAVVKVDIAERGRALITGPGFGGYVAQIPGPRSSTGRPTVRIYLEDDRDNGGRDPLPYVELALRKSFPAAACDLARRLADHYGHADVRIELDDETGTYTLPSEV